MNHYLKIAISLLTLGLLSGCTGQNLSLPEFLTQVSKTQENEASITNLPLLQHNVTITLLNLLSTNETIPLVPALVEKMTFDRLFAREEKDFPESKGIQEELPFLNAGEHLLEIKFKQISSPLLIPIVIPEDAKEKMNILVVFALHNSELGVYKITVGQDQNQDKVIDTDNIIYRSQDGEHYLIHHPDGKIENWKSKFLGGLEPNVSATDEGVLPPGTPSKETAKTETPNPKQDKNTTIPLDPNRRPPKSEPPKIPRLPPPTVR